MVALTAQAMRGDSERFLDVGFDGYLSKPVDIVELIRVVESTAIVSDPPQVLVVDEFPENVRLLKVKDRQIEELRASRKTVGAGRRSRSQQDRARTS